MLKKNITSSDYEVTLAPKKPIWWLENSQGVKTTVPKLILQYFVGSASWLGLIWASERKLKVFWCFLQANLSNFCKIPFCWNHRGVKKVKKKWNVSWLEDLNVDFMMLQVKNIRILLIFFSNFPLLHKSSLCTIISPHPRFYPNATSLARQFVQLHGKAKNCIFFLKFQLDSPSLGFTLESWIWVGKFQLISPSLEFTLDSWICLG